MRYIVPEREGKRSATRKCEVKGCLKATREGKPFCSNHIEHLPYIKQLVSERVDAEREKEEALKHGPRVIDIHGQTTHEIIHTLERNGTRTVARLAKDMGVEINLMRVYVRKLASCRIVLVSKQRRGTPVVRLNPKRK